MKSLAILLADLDMETAVKAILNRSFHLGIHKLQAGDYDVYRHPQRDSGCYRSAHEFMRRCLTTHQYLLVAFDYHGCGAEYRKSSEEIELDVEQRLSTNGWVQRCCVVVPDPELEIWIWSDSPHVTEELGWRGRQPSIREWLEKKGFWAPQAPKPIQPKEAMRAVLKEVRKPPSPAIFGDLASKVDLHKCTDRAFVKLKQTLQDWLGA